MFQKQPREKAMQRALIQYKNPENYNLVREALVEAGRTDLIGYGKKCLIAPRKGEGKKPGKVPKSPAARKEKIHPECA